MAWKESVWCPLSLREPTVKCVKRVDVRNVSPVPLLSACSILKPAKRILNKFSMGMFCDKVGRIWLLFVYVHCN